MGLVSGACFAELGHNVICHDVDETKVGALNQGEVPIYEPGLEELISRNVSAGRLFFTVDARQAYAKPDAVIVCVGTPERDDGLPDLSQVEVVMGQIISNLIQSTIVVDKSTVPVGTADYLESAINSGLSSRGKDSRVSVVSNPEFLREGTALHDFMSPDRIVVGCSSSHAETMMRALYSGINCEKYIVTSVRSAELIKYAANAMLATRISFMNELARVAEGFGADIDEIRRGIGSDERIGSRFLNAGLGYGGSCFPKDVRGLRRTARDAGLGDMEILKAVDSVNQRQKLIMVHKMLDHFGSLVGKVFAVWGLAFKPDTDDLRHAPSIEIIRALIQEGASIRVYDPVVRTLGEVGFDKSNVFHAQTAMGALEGVDALVVVTEWSEFSAIRLQDMENIMRSPVIFDGRNIFSTSDILTSRFKYFSIGRRPFE